MQCICCESVVRFYGDSSESFNATGLLRDELNKCINIGVLLDYNSNRVTTWPEVIIIIFFFYFQNNTTHTERERRF